MKQSNTHISDKDLWATPEYVVNGALTYFKQEGLLPETAVYIADACATKENTKHDNFFTEADNALVQSWSKFGEGVVWCNPPYSRGKKIAFIEKAIQESNDTIMILPSDTSTDWFKVCVEHAKAIAFICGGRISFLHNATGTKGRGNDAGSILVLFGKKDPTELAKTLYITREKLNELGFK